MRMDIDSLFLAEWNEPVLVLPSTNSSPIRAAPPLSVYYPNEIMVLGAGRCSSLEQQNTNYALKNWNTAELWKLGQCLQVMNNTFILQQTGEGFHRNRSRSYCMHHVESTTNLKKNDYYNSGKSGCGILYQIGYDLILNPSLYLTWFDCHEI